MQRILVTGAAGFIGYHLCNYLLDKKIDVMGIDNLNNYYDIKLKKARLKNLINKKIIFSKTDISDKETVENVFTNYQPDIVIHLAAQAGVRYSLENPYSYIDSNIYGFLNILEEARKKNVSHLIYASSSSIYGLNQNFPFSENKSANHPISLYAASKKSNEELAHAYSHIYKLPCTGLRFFTVYGPWGRPDMALFKFTKNILANEPIDVYGNGKMKRDFTYIDDIVDGIYKLISCEPKEKNNWDPENPNPSFSSAPWQIFNIGNNNPTDLEYFISVIEKSLNKKAIKNYLDIPIGDVKITAADIESLEKVTGFKPSTSIEDGIPKFIKWYKNFYI